MHSHDRTLLSKLGFSDPDKQNPLHDAACAYLAETEQSARLGQLFFNEPTTEASVHKGETKGCFCSHDCRCWASCAVEVAEENLSVTELLVPQEWIVRPEATLELHLTKGTGQYATTIGFVDTYVRAFRSVRYTGRRRHHIDAKIVNDECEWRRWTTEPFDGWLASGDIDILVEVKIARVPVGDALRQLKMYREYFELMLSSQYPRRYATPATILATAYPINTVDAAVLTREGIKHVRLGAGFEAWCNTKREVHASPEL